MKTRIKGEDGVFVHASDIQLLDTEAVEAIAAWQPDVVLASGPALYSDSLSPQQQQRAWANGVRLARSVNTLILDHHLLRSEEGLDRLEHLASETGGNVLCGADFMGYVRCLLEARRVELYEEIPVPEGWHAAYAMGEADVGAFTRE
ncbi:MAG: hypothetical protein JXA25_17610 [Anaerolineales bacterium]|nr:hypothetical protein [Anaerolineales bacterium]